MVHTMLDELCSNAQWSLQYEGTDKAMLGWCGWETPNVAVVNGILIVMDGFIYNRGDFGRVDNDAGLLATLYGAYGFENALQQINGDFAVALYDRTINTLWLARDRFGAKPLYYAVNPDQFAFASRPGALLTLPSVSTEANPSFVALFAASHYRYFDNNPEQSPYADIAQLPAAHTLRVSNGKVTKSVYWSLEDGPDFDEPEGELAHRYCELMVDAVSLRLRSGRRPAFTLSGGIDSSTVMACAAHISGEKQHAFSSVYVDRTYDESGDIEPMLATVEQWHPVGVGSPDILSLIREMIAIHDEPVPTATWLSHYLLCREVAGCGFGSLFGGLGGDELNAGEYEHFFYFFADLYAAGCDTLLERETRKWVAYHDHPIFRKSFEVMWDGLARLVDLSRPGRCLPDQRRLRRYFTALDRDYFDLENFQPVMDHPFRSYLKNRTFQDMFRETVPCCLRAEDRHTTAFGLGRFDPFFDHRLAEFMFRVPGTLKIRDGVTKYLLRQAMCRLLPEETRKRIKKTGWNAPAHVWFSGRKREPLLDLVRSRAFRERGIYNVQEVDRLVDEHEQIISSGQQVENHMMFLWQLVNLELWLQQNLARRGN